VVAFKNFLKLFHRDLEGKRRDTYENKTFLTAKLTFVLLSLVSVTIAAGQHRPTAENASLVSLPIQYKVIDLGTDGVGNGITDAGRIVGSKNFGGPQRHAAFWPSSQSVPIDLGTLPGRIGSRGYGVNPGDKIVGVSGPFAAFWPSSKSAPVTLPGLPPDVFGIATAAGRS
jgi:hypothetical protein